MVLPLDEKKDVSCLVKPIDPVLIDLDDDDDDVEEVPAPIVSMPTRQQAIKQSRVQKIKAVSLPHSTGKPKSYDKIIPDLFSSFCEGDVAISLPVECIPSVSDLELQVS